MKNCLRKEELFNYYHKELDNKKIQEIKKHIDSCQYCQKVIDEIDADVGLVKTSLDLLNPELTETNENSVRVIKRKKLNYTRILSWAASISLIITISTIALIKSNYNQKPVNDYEYLEYVPDMNDAWNEKAIIITQYDKNGNPVRHQSITD